MTSVKDLSADSDASAAPEDSTRHPRWLAAAWLVPVTLAVLIPGLRLQAYQAMHAFRVVPFLYTLPVVAAVAVAVFAGLSGGFRRRIPWALGVTTMVLLVVFVQADLNLAMEEVAGSAPRLVVEVVPVLVAVLAVWIAVRMAATMGYFVMMTLATTIIFLSIAAINVGTYVAVPGYSAVAAADPARPDVLILVLDGYARDDVLAERYRFDNEPFLTALADRGFAVPRNVAANYTGTYGALAAIYALDYPVADGTMSGADHDRIAATLAGDNVLMRSFSEAGYDITFFENGWEGSTCPPAADVCVRDGLWAKTMWDLGNLTLLAPVVESRWTHPFTSMAVPQMERLVEITGQDSAAGSPRLIMAHITVPHPPLHLDAACTLSNAPEGRRPLIREPGMTEAEVEARLALFGDQTACVNSTVLAAVDGFLEGNPDGLVMITADHGPDSFLQASTNPYEWSRTAITERTAIMSAYRIDDACVVSVSDSMSPVNGARLVSDCALGGEYAALPDRSYTIPAPGDPIQDVIDLSDAVAPNG